jgi:plasmid stabilization system protein ParE
MAAMRAVEALERAVASLDQFPLRTPRKGSPETHEMIVRFGRAGYVIRYRVRDDEVVITRIFHGREQR